MAMISTGNSAQIYEFPVGGRNLGARRFDHAGTVSDLRPKHVLTVDYSNWYHDEAIREDQKPKS